MRRTAVPRITHEMAAINTPPYCADCLKVDVIYFCGAAPDAA
jgi:hypothetical protein